MNLTNKRTVLLTFGLLISILIPPLQAAPLNISTPFPDPDIIAGGAELLYTYDGDWR